MVWTYLFWISCFVVFFNYAGYAIIVYFFNSLKKDKPAPPTDFFLTVSFLVALYHEEHYVDEKIKTSFAKNDPADKIEYIFVTDGSSDSTPDRIRKYPGVRLLHEAARAGKSAAINRAVTFAKNEILIFSDANTN